MRSVSNGTKQITAAKWLEERLDLSDGPNHKFRSFRHLMGGGADFGGVKVTQKNNANSGRGSKSTGIQGIRPKENMAFGPWREGKRW